jgi:hypothetical protein
MAVNANHEGYERRLGVINMILNQRGIEVGSHEQSKPSTKALIKGSGGRYYSFALQS